MSDDGRRTEGQDGTRSSHTGQRTSEDPHPGGEGAALGKILPVPRDWFGPIEDLVPVFPEPQPDPATAISAASFWDEDAGAVHQAVESLDRRWVGEDGTAAADGPLAELEVEVDELDAELTPAGLDAAAAPRGSAGGGRAWALIKLGAGLVGLIAVGAVVAVLLLTGGLRHPLSLLTTKQVASHVAHRKHVATVTLVPTVTVVTPAQAPVKRARPRRRTGVARRSTTHAPAPAAARSTPAPSTYASAGTVSSAGGGSAAYRAPTAAACRERQRTTSSNDQQGSREPGHEATQKALAPDRRRPRRRRTGGRRLRDRVIERRGDPRVRRHEVQGRDDPEVRKVR
jgi:hypothetical protein